MLKKLLVLADVPNWAFDKIYHGLKHNLNNWEVVVRYGTSKEVFQNCDEFNVVLNLLDYLPHLLVESSLPKEKVVMAIRSNCYEDKPDFYDNRRLLESRVGAFVVANATQYLAFRQRHSSVFLAPGGIDTSFFLPKEKKIADKPIVGWAGSRDNFGREFRGLDLIEKACIEADMEFRPAYREDKWRTEAEMLAYYQNEIDIYVDMSISAGRQNGLLEAASCGKTLISSHAGIADQLIDSSKSGFLINRTAPDLIACLNSCREGDAARMGSEIRQEVVKNWSWKTQAKLFEVAFDSLLDSSNSGMR